MSTRALAFLCVCARKARAPQSSGVFFVRGLTKSDTPFLPFVFDNNNNNNNNDKQASWKSRTKTGKIHESTGKSATLRYTKQLRNRSIKTVLRCNLKPQTEGLIAAGVFEVLNGRREHRGRDTVVAVRVDVWSR